MSTSPALLRNAEALPNDPTQLVWMLQSVTLNEWRQVAFGESCYEYADVVDHVWTVMSTKRNSENAQNLSDESILKTFVSLYSQFERISMEYSYCDYKIASVFSCCCAPFAQVCCFPETFGTVINIIWIGEELRDMQLYTP